jgi:transketolase
VAKGGYILRDPSRAPLEVILVATGSEVSLALEASDLLQAEAINARVVSMPSWELFEAQDHDYRVSVLPPDVPAISVEAGVAQGWSRFADVSVALERFGASAPGAELLRRLGVTAERLAAVARATLEGRRTRQ